MIQVIGLMIAFYIGYRGLEGMLDTSRPAPVKVAAIVLICVALIGAALLLMGGAAAPGLPRSPY